MGDRIAIFGRAGKSSLGQAIATHRHVPHIDIDDIHHMPGWVERPTEGIRQIIEERMDAATEGWVYNGNHRPVRDFIMASADTVIVIDLPWTIMLARYFKRSLKRCWTHEEIAGGNYETWRRAFASKESHLWYMFKSRGRDYLEEFGPLMSENSICYSIKTADDLNNFYKLHGLVRNA
jgi:adenylate kinase family enzyme